MRATQPLRRLALALTVAAGCASAGARGDAAPGDAAPGDTTTADTTGQIPEVAPEVAIEFDLGHDFSFTANPNGPWRYGATRGPALVAADFVLDAVVVDTSPPIGFWHPGPGADGYYPYVAANLGPTLSADPTDSWALRSAEIAMEGSADGRYSVVQFVVPTASTYQLHVDFTAIHIRLATTDVHVLLGETALFDAPLDGYGGDPAFHPLAGTHPSATFDVTRQLAAGAVLSFAVGVGANGTNYNDTTGLFVHLRR